LIHWRLHEEYCCPAEMFWKSSGYLERTRLRFFSSSATRAEFARNDFSIESRGTALVETAGTVWLRGAWSCHLLESTELSSSLIQSSTT
jgi:hypothetical protein